MLTGVSSATRDSHQRAISSACRLVSEAANLQPVLPVQATSPARTALVSVASSSASIFACAAFNLSNGTPEISRFCQTVSLISPSPRSREISARPFICATVNRPTGTTTPIQCNVLFLRVNANMGGAIEGRARSQRAGHGAIELAAELLLHQAEEFLDTHFVEHVFKPRLGAVGAIAGIDEHSHHRVGHFGGVGRLDHYTGITGKTAVTGEPTQAEPEPDARLKSEALVHLHGLKADIVGVFQHRNNAGAVEADVEFARQAVQRAVVEDVEVPFARIGTRIDQLLPVDTGRRSAGDVADIVGARAARAQAEVLHCLDH